MMGADLKLAEGERWYVVHTQPHKEIGAQMQLANQNFRSFLPRMRKTRRHARKVDTVLVPFFPRYLFVILNLKRDQWRSVNGTFGVSQIIMQNVRPQSMPKGSLDHLLSCVGQGGVLDFDGEGRLAIGQSVALTVGSFAGKVGTIEQLDGNGRVRLLLDLMDNKIPVVVSGRDVMPVGQ